MSSGSLKDLTKAITNASTSSTIALPLPEDLLQVIYAYLEKHATHDESDEKRLQEDLLNVYQSSIIDHPARLAPFLAILRLLKSAIRGSGRLLQWWDKLSPPIMVHLGIEKGLAVEVKSTLLSILIYDEDEDDSVKEDAKATSDALVENLLSTWFAKTKLAQDEFDDHAKFVQGQIQLILLAFGKKRPEDFLMAIDKFVVRKDSRIPALSLLGEFFRHQPPHLHQLLQTPLFHNLLRCLQIDTSTRAICLAMTALVMFLPHIPISASKHLPALFNIYTRLLFWDRERGAVSLEIPPENDDEDGGKSVLETENGTWEKLPYLLESEDDTVPELLHYFTFLYGLYPINFMDYIRKPQRYLRHANFPGADDLDVEPAEIRQRSETFRQVHLLHPNFFHLTIESELTDNHRWSRSSAADVVAECMALYVSSEDGNEHDLRQRKVAKKVELSTDFPDQPLLERDPATPFQSRHTSWRNTTSTAVASPEGLRLNMPQRKSSQHSQSMPSIAAAPSLPPDDRIDSPTLPPRGGSSNTSHQLSDLLASTRPTRGSLYKSLTNDSVASLALSNTIEDPTHVDAYLASLAREDIPRSPSLRPTTVPPSQNSLTVAYLHRDIQLLKNDLNFERYLKQQHLSHIGQLRRKQIREARVEAETQNLINSNRGLKSKLEEAKRLNAQMKKETEKSKTHSRKWESDLSVKLRVLREEQKKWNMEREQLNKDLSVAIDNAKALRLIVVTSERNELNAKQKVASVEASLDELDRLRAEVEKLTARIRSYEAGERDALQAKENEIAALHRIELLQMELRVRDEELLKTKEAYEEEICMIQSSQVQDEFAVGENVHENRQSRQAILTHEVIDSALATSRARIIDLKKAHNHLLGRYNQLQSSYVDLRERLQQVTSLDEPLLSGGISNVQSPVRTNSRRVHASPTPEPYDYVSSPPTGPLPAVPNRPSRLDTTQRSNSNTPTDGRSPTAGGSTSYFASPRPFSPSAGGKAGAEHDAYSKPKIKPQSEVRIYGRGGVQNFGKKDKEKKEAKGKERAREDSPTPDGKKEKKGLGVRGLRGF